MTRDDVGRWVDAYEVAWRSPGTDALSELFTPDATYLPDPYSDALTGLDEIGRFWDEEREGPDEVFTLDSEVVAVEGDTALVRLEVRYGDPVTQEFRDLWVLRFDESGKVNAFEEWATWPGRA